MSSTAKDESIVRDLARRVGEVAALPEQAAKADLWRRHNRLDSPKPLVLIFPEGSWREVIGPEDLQTSDPICRAHEMDLRRRLYYHEHIRDDNVVTDLIRSPIVVRSTGYGVDADVVRPDEPTGTARYEPVIKTEDDFAAKVRRPEITIDWTETDRLYQQNCELFDGILRVEKHPRPRPGSFSMIDTFSQWRGLNQLMLDMVDRPEWLDRCLQFLTDCELDLLDVLEREGALTLNNRDDYVGSGGVGYSDELPQPDFDGRRVRTIDLWGFATTQIFSEVSPAMHEQFALRYEIQFLARFGLNCYGCCEPLHLKMDDVSKIPRLRRISMSPWVDMDRAAELLGDRYVFSRKPNPALLAAPTWNTDAVRRSLRDDLERTHGCVVELIMKDTHTVAHRPQRLADWVRIAKEEVDRFVG